MGVASLVQSYDGGIHRDGKQGQQRMGHREQQSDDAFLEQQLFEKKKKEAHLLLLLWIEIMDRLVSTLWLFEICESINFT